MPFWEYLFFNKAQRSLKAAERALRNKQFAKAVSLLDKVIAQKPDYHLFYFLRGAAHQNLRDYVSALRDYNQTLRLNRSHVGTYFNRGLLYGEDKDCGRALEDFTTAINLKHDAFAMRAVVYSWVGNGESALSDIQEAVRRKPFDADTRYLQATVHRRLGMEKEALLDLDKALSLDTRYQHAHNLKAWILATSEQDEIRDGRKALEHALKAKGNEEKPHPAIIGTLAAAYAETGDFEQAVFWATFFLDNNPPEENIEKAKNCLELYRRRETYRESADSLETVRDNRPVG